MISFFPGVRKQTMSFNLEDFLLKLTSKKAPSDKHAREELIRSASIVAHSYDQADPANQATLVSLLQKMAAHKDSFLGALIHSLLFHMTGNPQNLKKLSSHLMRRQADLKETNGSFYSLSAMSFKSSGDEASKLDMGVGRRTFMKLFKDCKKQVRRLYKQIADADETPFAPNDHVVILTRQFLMPPHAPSLDTLKFAARLIQEYGKQVLIISTSEASAGQDGAVAPAVFANTDQRFVGRNKLDYEGVSISFALCGNGVFSDESVLQAIKMIEVVKPEMILSVGSPSLIAEVFAHRCFTFTYPTARGIPILEDCNFHTWDQPDEDMQSIVKREKLQEKYLFAQHPGFDVKPPSDGLTRAQFSIPEDKFVFVVVGVRLDTDVNTKFLELLERITDHPSAYIVFAGNFETYEKVVSAYPNVQKQSARIGFQTDIMAVYNISDAFLNPERKGGGSGIVYALQAGLPVLSLPTGDAGLAAAGFPETANYDALAETCVRLIDDKDMQAEYAKIAVAEAPKFSGRAALLERIMEEFKIHSEKQIN